jgi:hypothetical protein
MPRRADTLIRDWETRLHANALASAVLATLNQRKSEVERAALDGLQRENPQFERATSKQFRDEALGHCNDILQLMLAIAQGCASGLEPDPFDFVATHAVRRARQQFPLAGSLNAYRLAHKGYWEVMRNAVAALQGPESEKTDCLMILSEFLLEFFDRVSGVLTDGYITEEKRLVARRARTHVALIEDLMHGRQPGDLEAQALCERCGIRAGASMAVVIGRPRTTGNGGTAGHSGALARLSERFHQALDSPALVMLIDIRNDEVLAIIAGGAETSRRVQQALGAAAAELTEVNAGIGISLDASEIAALPQAYQEAERAVEFTESARPLMHFADIDLMEFLVRRPDAAALRLIPDWAGRFLDIDNGKSGELTRTISQFADCNFNVKRTARHLDLHTNTVYFRLNRIRELTGIDPRSYSGLSLLLTTVRMLNAGAGRR